MSEKSQALRQLPYRTDTTRFITTEKGCSNLDACFSIEEDRFYRAGNRCSLFTCVIEKINVEKPAFQRIEISYLLCNNTLANLRQVH